MKKNLFGAVSAALALALAITSFGCESGNDNPIRAVTDADRAALDGTVFKYVATPTEYTATGTPSVTEAATEKGELYSASTGYSYNKFINGVQNYNIKTADSWGKADVTKPAVGDVIKTKSETVALNAKNNTFEYGASSSDYAVKEIYWSSTGAAPSTDANAYDTITSTYAGTAPTAAEIDTALTAAETAKKSADAALADKQDAWNKLTPSEKKTQSDAKSGTEYDALEIAKTNATNAGNQFEWLTVYKEGARYSILNTKTVNGATTGSLKYVKSLDKQELVKEVSKASGEAKATATGTYKVVDGGYLTGTILITSYKKGDDTYEFNDDADTYIKTGLHIARKISDDFNQTATQGWSPNSKKARTLSINNNVLTAPQFETTSTAVGEASKAYAYFLNSSLNTAKRAVDDNTRVTAVSTATGFYNVSYSYVYK